MTERRLPFRLKTNRMSYLIPGGSMIDRFLGEPEGNHPMASQMWIASTVCTALNGGKDGCSWILEEDGGGSFPKLLKEDSESYLGKEFTKKYGPTTGFLLKLLNSRDRLLVQVHPDREKAKTYFGLPCGKTEAWFVLDTEPGEKAYIWAGFHQDVTRETFRRLIEEQDTQKILAQLHCFEIKKGDVILIEPGTPHALGNHSLVAEIQEPVDLTLRAERFRPDGSELPEESLHSGIGLDGLLDCFRFQCQDRETTRQRIFVQPRGIIRKEEEELCLIGKEQTGCFSMSQITVREKTKRKNRRFTVGLVLEGEGKLMGEQISLPLKQGTEFFLPACMENYQYCAGDFSSKLRILECYPPEI